MRGCEPDIFWPAGADRRDDRIDSSANGTLGGRTVGVAKEARCGPAADTRCRRQHRWPGRCSTIAPTQSWSWDLTGGEKIALGNILWTTAHEVTTIQPSIESLAAESYSKALMTPAAFRQAHRIVNA